MPALPAEVRAPGRIGSALALAALAGCGAMPEGRLEGPAFLDAGREAPSAQDALDEGHRLMDAGDAEGALGAFRRAAVAGGGPDALAAMGSANLALGRLGQAEPLLRRATERKPGSAAAWNNLGVLLLETGRPGEAAASFRRAYALGDGASEAVRRNLVLARGLAEAPPGAPLPAGATIADAAAEQ